MINITIKRDYFPTHTYAVWYRDDLPLGLYSIEKPWLDNAPEVSCIPHGEYRCTLYSSPSKGLVYLLHDVFGREMIEIHKANFQSELLGCLGIGLSFGILKNKDGKNEAAVLNSSAALGKLMTITDNKEFDLIIT